MTKALALATGSGADGAPDAPRKPGRPAADGPTGWFDRAVVDRLRVGQLELASNATAAPGGAGRAGEPPRAPAAGAAAVRRPGGAAGIRALGLGTGGGLGAGGEEEDAVGRRRQRGRVAKAAAAVAAAGEGALSPGQLYSLKMMTQRWPHSLGLWNLYCSAHAQVRRRLVAVGGGWWRLAAVGGG